MHKNKAVRGSVLLRPRLRVLCDGETALGPGRVDLLEHIAETGSLRSAAARMNMSYMRTWMIVKSLNNGFERPWWKWHAGEKVAAGLHLTDAGRMVVISYHRMEKQSMKVVKETWGRLRASIILAWIESRIGRERPGRGLTDRARMSSAPGLR